jgi:hypothetical protein
MSLKKGKPIKLDQRDQTMILGAARDKAMSILQK